MQCSAQDEWVDYKASVGTTDAQFLTLLEKIIEEQKEQRRLLQLLLTRGPAVEENSSSLPEEVSFPITTVEDIDSLNELLKESDKYSCVVKYLSLFGGTNARETVNRLIKEVMVNELAVQYNLQGQKGKLPLNTLHIMGVLFRALQRNPSTKLATRKDLELEVRKWVTGMGAEKKNQTLVIPPQNDTDNSDGETQDE